MAITYTWKLKSLKKTSTSQFNDIVVETNWELTGTDEDGDSGTFHGTTPFAVQDVNGDGFIDYKDLTEEIVIGWIQEVVTGGYKQHVDEQIIRQIMENKNPVVEVLESELPWTTPVS